MSRTLPYYLAGEWEHSEIVKNNYNPYTGNVLGEICFADTDAAERAIKAATKIFEWLPQEPASARSEILRDIAAILKNQADIIPQVITAETGKPIRFARREVARTIEIFELYSEQTVHTTTVSTLEPSRFSAGAGKIAFTRRVPVGPVLAITPFVFPFNFPAKKIAGALACGCPVILKPSPYAPQSALLLAKLLDEADLPEGLLSVLPASDEVTQFMVRHNGIKAINFTGSSEAGWFIRSIAGNKKVLLNLGNSSANIVHKDVRNIKRIAERMAAGAFAASGQLCLSVQRIYVHKDIFAKFMNEFVAVANRIKVSDPAEETTLLGCVINEAHAVRISDMLKEAVQNGAQIILGGKSWNTNFEPTIVINVEHNSSLIQQEVFGPVVVVVQYDDFSMMLNAVNGTKFGLQAALFTQDINLIMQAFEALDVGSLVVNDYSALRIDHLPFGGMKASGFGREGLNEIIDFLTEKKTLIISK